MEIEIEFLTPAFLYGATHQMAEFRIPSLLGQMRYWWRMTQNWDKMEELREKEAAVFGLGDQGARPFYLYLKEKSSTPAQMPKPLINKKNGRQETDSGTGEPLFKFPTENAGISYFFYPFMRHPNRFSWIPPGYRISLVFEPVTAKEGILEQIQLSLFLTGRFGGLGARSRRGGGSIKVSIPGCSLFDLTENNLSNYMKGNGRSDSDAEQYFSFIQQDSPLRAALTRQTRFRTNIRSAENWEKSLGAVGAEMQGFRTKHKMMSNAGNVEPAFLEEARNLHAYFNGNGAPPRRLTKDAFGLPRIINFPPARDYLSVAPYKEDKEMRRASPLHISVNRGANGQFYCTFLILWEKIDFLPRDMQLQLKKAIKGKKDEYTSLQIPGPEKLEAFMRRF